MVGGVFFVLFVLDDFERAPDDERHLWFRGWPVRKRKGECAVARAEDSRELPGLSVLRTRRTSGWVKPRHWGIEDAIGFCEFTIWRWPQVKKTTGCRERRWSFEELCSARSQFFKYVFGDFS